MIGVQTIGNATLVAYDQSPIISTDPWMGGDHYAYFGSWHLPYEIPNNIKQDIINSISNDISVTTLIVFWQFVLKVIDEL